MKISIKPKHIRFIIQLLSIALIIFNRSVENCIVAGTFLIMAEIENLTDEVEKLNK